ncbi:MAG: hypothetical protein AAGE59_08870 [Cyanobacteria bacterium P01_F01_bin.86]
MNGIRYLGPWGLIGFISLLSLTASASFAQSMKATSSYEKLRSPAAIIESENATGIEHDQTFSENTETEVSCPPGQFPSAFADVLPNNWAYTAVNNVASVPITCFNFPETQ